MPINKKHITYDLFSVTQRLVDSTNKHEEENNCLLYTSDAADEPCGV